MQANPLREGPRLGSPPAPVSLVIYGATGDLTQRKLVPALYSLAQEELLPATINIVGFARRPWSDEDFRAHLLDGVQHYARYEVADSHGAQWTGFADDLYYVQGNFDAREAYGQLDHFLAQKAAERGMPDNRLYYLATPPEYYAEIVESMGALDMSRDRDSGWRRIIIEKPFGVDLSTAQSLNGVVHKVFDERQVYRIDHYLGKETVQNILVLRFANAIFEPVWNRRYVDHVQISVAESVGVETRAGFYDKAGVIRDIFQNHALQVLTLIAMEPPVAFEADAIRDEKVKVLRAMRVIQPEEVPSSTVRAQYEPGTVDGERVPGYCDVEGVAPHSQTPTYAAIRWFIDNWRWQGVPFYIRSGKRMPLRATEVAIQFKRPPHLLFAAHESASDDAMRANVLAIRVQPDEGISLRFEAKLPGQGVIRRPVTMDFRYRTSFGIADPPEAYERLLLDAMLGDATLFARSDEIEHAWRQVDPILNAWQSSDDPLLEVYEAGTWGPEGAEKLMARDGRQWRRL